MQENFWIGPAAVLCQRGQSIWIHTNGDIKKVATCKVKPYELVDRTAISENNDNVSKKVMLEDGLENVEDLMDKKDEQKESELDNIGAKYLKVVNSVSFSDVAFFTVELPVSEHWKPEVKGAKDTEVENLLDYDIFEEVNDKGQDTIGSRWVITSKGKHDGQKKKTKVRLVARGF